MNLAPPARTVEKHVSYESGFDNFYRSQWQHEVRRQDVYLNEREYPFSVALPLPPGGTWLELGVGGGRVVAFHAETIARLHATCVGLDYSEAALRRCREILPPSVSLVRGDIRQLPFDEDTFDVITLFGTLQALDRKEWIPRAADLLRYVKPGGCVGFSLHPVCFVELVRCCWSPELWRNTITRRTLERALRAQGVDYTIEKHHVLTLYKRLAAALGMRLPLWCGFREFRSTKGAVRLARWLRACPVLPTFGHWWVWLRRPATGEAAASK